MNRFRFAALAVAVAASTWGCAQAPVQAPKAAASAPAPAAAAAPVAAPAAGTAAQPQGGKAAQVSRFLEIQQPVIETLARELVTQSSDPIARAASQYLRAKVPEAQRPELAKAADTEFRNYFDDVYPMVRAKALAEAPGTIGPILERNFSEDELRQLNDWLSSPVAKKYLGLNPELQSTLMRQVVTATRGTIEPKVRQLNVDVAKALGAEGPAPAQGGAKGRGAAKGK